MEILQYTQEKIELLLEEKLPELGLFLIEAKVLPGLKIQVFVERIEGRITIQDCARLSRQLEPGLDEDPGIPENYNLEVSSPGMSNPFKIWKQYEKNTGRKVEILRANGEKLTGTYNVLAEGVIQLFPEKKGKKEVSKEPLSLEIKDIKQTKLSF